MKNHILFLILLSLLILGCGNEAPKVKKPIEPIIYKTALVCDANMSSAQIKATKLLLKDTKLQELSTYAKLEQNHEKKIFCFESIVYQSGWTQYEKNLLDLRKEILTKLHELNNTVLFSQKKSTLETWTQEARVFNKKLEKSRAIAPVRVQEIDINTTELIGSINAAPDVAIRFMGCNRGSNYQCRVTYISKIKDESLNVQYSWKFGDGATSNRRTPLHTYRKTGTYDVILRVVDEKGASSEVDKTLHVKKSSKPIAIFTTNKNKYNTYEPVVVSNKSYTQKSKIVRYQWRFGDGKLSSNKTPIHRYTEAGKYYIQLKVCSANGACSSASKKVVISGNRQTIKVKKGTPIERYIAHHGKPQDSITKKKSSMAAYRYGNIWLLAKRGKIRCAVDDKGLSINLLGQPKKCDWHEKHAKRYMFEFR